MSNSQLWHGGDRSDGWNAACDAARCGWRIKQFSPSVGILDLRSIVDISQERDKPTKSD